jgi:hypothetical protein
MIEPANTNPNAPLTAISQLESLMTNRGKNSSRRAGSGNVFHTLAQHAENEKMRTWTSLENQKARAHDLNITNANNKNALDKITAEGDQLRKNATHFNTTFLGENVGKGKVNVRLGDSEISFMHAGTPKPAAPSNSAANSTTEPDKAPESADNSGELVAAVEGTTGANSKPTRARRNTTKPAKTGPNGTEIIHIVPPGEQYND